MNFPVFLRRTFYLGIFLTLGACGGSGGEGDKPPPVANSSISSSSLAVNLSSISSGTSSMQFGSSAELISSQSSSVNKTQTTSSAALGFSSLAASQVSTSLVGGGSSISLSSSFSTPSSSVISKSSASSETFKNIPLQKQITKVQPMTGIVLWADSHNNSVLKTDDQYVQLEYAYVRPSDVVIADNTYDWTPVETLLNAISARRKQAILRWYYVYPGEATAVPGYIKALSDYKETVAKSEGRDTHFPDWSHPELQQATLDFYSAFAARYDKDPRIAFLQVGFGLWGEYHIYDPAVKLGVNFPSKQYQTQFLQHLDSVFDDLHWSISIDAGDSANTPIAGNINLLALRFGNFDDSFMHEDHADYNKAMWTVFGYNRRYEHSPHGGELSYYSDYDQKNALNAGGMYGRTYESLSREFHITYMIGNDQPAYQTAQRIKDAGLANGYQFEVTEFKATSTHSRVTVRNRGVAPIYYHAYPTVNGVRALQTLKGLLPAQSITVDIQAGGSDPTLTIESPRLINGQEIQYSANL